jgi:hypothetical protein
VTALSFLLVGTPRSGTTVTQRLCCELAGVAMPPETHFLQLFAPRLLARRRLPLSHADVVEALDEFRALPTSAGLEVDTDLVLARLGGRCDRLIDLFAAVVVALCPSSGGTCYGEKTPEHLLWWRPLTAADPTLKIIGVVRDPRSVAVSHRAVPWGVRDAAELAEEWAFDQRQLLAASRTLGPQRCLVLRYEDVVADPRAAQLRIAGFLGAGAGATCAAPADIVHPWEWWKAQALAPVATTRTSAWPDSLDPVDVAAVEAVAGREMAAFGYPTSRGIVASRRAGPEVRSRLAGRLRRVRALASLAGD